MMDLLFIQSPLPSTYVFTYFSKLSAHIKYTQKVSLFKD